MAGGVAGGVQVVVQQPTYGGLAVGGRVDSGQGAGVVGEQIMEAVAAPCGFVE